MEAFVANLPVFGDSYIKLAQRAGLSNELTLRAINQYSMAEGVACADEERLFAIVPRHATCPRIPASMYTYAVNNWAHVGFGGTRELLSLAVHIQEDRVPASFLGTNAEIFGFGSMHMGARQIMYHSQGLMFDIPDLVSPMLYVGKNGRAITREPHTDCHRVGHTSRNSTLYTLLVTRHGPEVDSLSDWQQWARNPHGQ